MPTGGTQPDIDAAARRARLRRRIGLLLLIDVMLLLAAFALWLTLRSGDGEENAVNAGLRGSLPPAGQTLPQLDVVRGVQPPLPTRQELEGSAVALVATCLQCRSGDIIGGFLGRIQPATLPGDASVHVIGWGDAEAWRTQWAIPDEFVVHEVAPAGVDDARRAFGIGPVDGAEESGVTYLYDTAGRWRSSFYVGQLDRDDLLHDLGVLASER